MYLYLKSPNSKENTLVYIRYSPVKFKYSTSKKIHPKDWNFESRTPKVKRGRTDLNLINTQLNKYTTLLTKLLDNAELNDIEITKDYLNLEFNKVFNPNRTNTKTGKPKFLSDGVLMFINAKNKSKGKSISWNEKYHNLFVKLKLFDFYKNKTHSINKVDEDWIDEYCGFLRTLPEILDYNQTFKSKVIKFNQTVKFKLPNNGYNDNTLNRHINFLKTYLMWAIPGYIVSENKIKNPVKDYEPDNVSFTFKELFQFENVVLDSKIEKDAKAVFLAGVYSGQRVSDYSVFNETDIVNTDSGDIIVKRAEKTEHDSIIPISKKLRAILEEYNWKLPTIEEHYFNDLVRLISFKAGIRSVFKKHSYSGNVKNVRIGEKHEFVSSHTARRTFITLSLEKGMRYKTVMKITGIKNLETLLKYEKLKVEAIQESYFKIWGF